jgi:hypothetical protein
MLARLHYARGSITPNPTLPGRCGRGQLRAQVLAPFPVQFLRSLLLSFLPTWRHALPAQPTGHAVEWHAAIARWLARVLQTQPASDRAVLSSMSEPMLRDIHAPHETRLHAATQRHALARRASRSSRPGCLKLMRRTAVR